MISMIHIPTGHVVRMTMVWKISIFQCWFFVLCKKRDWM